jgi:hypothetical protein
VEEIKVEGGKLKKTEDPNVFHIEVFSEGNYKFEGMRRLDRPISEARDEGKANRSEVEEALTYVEECVEEWRKDRLPFPRRDSPDKPSDLVMIKASGEKGFDALRERLGYGLGELLYFYSPVREIFFEHGDDVRDLLGQER